MNNVETILVILLSVGFLILLILSISLVILMLSIMRNVKRISQKAEEATENVSELAAALGRKVAPIAVSTVVAAIMRKFNKGKE